MAMDQQDQDKRLHELFIVSLLFKGANALLEIVGGVILLYTPAAIKILTALANSDLIQDINDNLSLSLQQYVFQITDQTFVFAALYLLSHGVIKMGIIVALIRREQWAFPAAFVVFASFIIYQMFRYFHTHSIFLIALSLFDLLVIWLTWHEYQRVLRQHRFIEESVSQAD